MSLWQQFLISIRSLFSSRSQGQQSVASLSQEVLEAALREARFLQSRHKVEVRSLAEGENAGPPKPADGCEPPPSPH